MHAQFKGAPCTRAHINSNSHTTSDACVANAFSWAFASCFAAILATSLDSAFGRFFYFLSSFYSLTCLTSPPYSQRYSVGNWIAIWLTLFSIFRLLHIYIYDLRFTICITWLRNQRTIFRYFVTVSIYLSWQCTWFESVCVYAYIYSITQQPEMELFECKMCMFPLSTALSHSSFKPPPWFLSLILFLFLPLIVSYRLHSPSISSVLNTEDTNSTFSPLCWLIRF